MTDLESSGGTSMIALKDAALLTSGHPDILRAEERVYKAVAERQGYDPSKLYKMSSVCGWITHAMDSEFEQQGYEFWPMERRLASRWRRLGHVYLRSAETSKGLIIVDGAWTQFVPHRRRDPDLPRVAVGTPDEVVALASGAGVRERYLDYWRMPAPATVAEEIDLRFSYGLHDQL